MPKVRSVWIVTPLVAIAALATGYYIATAHNPSYVNPVSVIKQRIDPVAAEQAWIDTNLPAGNTVLTEPEPFPNADGSVGNGETTYQYRFHIIAVDAGTWRIVATESIQAALPNGEPAPYSTSQISECTASVREMDWIRNASIVTGYWGPLMIVDDGKLRYADYDPLANVYDLEFPSDNLKCDSTFHQSGRPDDSLHNPVLEIHFKSEEAAESALQAIIRHVNPDAAKANEVEAKWVKDHLEIETTAKDHFERANFSTLFYSSLIYPLKVDDWVVKNTWTVRWEGQDSHYQQKCSFAPSQIDWQNATITHDDGTFDVYDLHITGTKGFLGFFCEGVNTDDKEATNMDKITQPKLEFATEEKAKQWLDDVRQHEAAIKAAAPTKQ